VSPLPPENTILQALNKLITLSEQELSLLGEIITGLKEANSSLAKIERLLSNPDVASINVSVGTPTKQPAGEGSMAGNVKSLGTPFSQSMLDDQQAVMTASPLEADGTPGAFATGVLPVWTVSPGTALTLDTTTDPTEVTAIAKGIHGQAGTETVTVTYTNPDGTVATGGGTFTMTVDPAELDVSSINVTVGTPTAQ
jgi:hypothetical protein